MELGFRVGGAPLTGVGVVGPVVVGVRALVAWVQAVAVAQAVAGAEVEEGA